MIIVMQKIIEVQTGILLIKKKYSNLKCIHFADKSVLIIGIGISGTELMSAISKTAKNVTLSCRVINAAIRPPTNVTMKGVVQEITETGAIFVDGSEEKFDNIIYCTGELCFVGEGFYPALDFLLHVIFRLQVTPTHIHF